MPKAKILLCGIFVFAASSIIAQPDTCSGQLQALLNSRAKEVSIGVAHIHKYRLDPGDTERMVSVLVPNTNDFPGSKLADLAAQDWDNPWPTQFVISDGYVSANFMHVDLRQNSPLKLELKRMLKKIKDNGIDPREDQETFLQHIASQTRNLPYGDDPMSLRATNYNTWNTAPRYSMGEETKNIFGDHLGKTPSAQVFPTNETRDLVAFEAYVTTAVCSQCIQHAMLASLLLREAKIPHRMRTGFANLQGPTYNNTGHTIIELKDGRILDPTWNILGKPKKHDQYPEWISAGTHWWTPNDHFPYLILEP